MDIETYARVMVELASGERRRAEVLAGYDLDEESWAEIDEAFQDRLSRAMDADDAVPPIVSRYAKAYEDAQRELVAPISIEQFARVTKLLSATSDLRAALARAGVTMAEYVRATAHYSPRFAHDPDLVARFERALRSG